jgi:hypothetical protein
MDKRQKINGNTYHAINTDIVSTDVIEVLSTDPCFRCGSVTQPPDKCYLSTRNMGGGLGNVAPGNAIPISPNTTNILCIYCYVIELFNL